jgi:hypothetical protein
VADLKMKLRHNTTCSDAGEEKITSTTQLRRDVELTVVAVVGGTVVRAHFHDSVWSAKTEIGMATPDSRNFKTNRSACIDE